MTTPAPNFQPTILYNLVPGQYQIGNKVIGRGTTVRMENLDVKPYDQNNQDYQISRSDQVNFGQDTFKPSTIELTFDVINNSLRPGYEDLIPNFWEEMPKVRDFAAIWRNDNKRLISGSMVPLYVCGKDGITRVVYGRPGQFTYPKEESYDEFVQCLAEFRRGDTLSYTARESVIELGLSADPIYLIREQGDGPDTWLRFLLIGPLVNPVITLGDKQINLDYTIEAGNAVEISSYPWSRRIVDATGLSLDEHLIGPYQYLDKFKLPYGTPIALKWNSGGANTFVPALGDQRWEENIDGYGFFSSPPGFTEINGVTAVRYDLFNWSDNSIIPTPRKYLNAGTLATGCASIYSANSFQTAYQRAETQLVNPGLWAGKSVLTIMTNDDMSQLVGVMCDNDTPGQHYLRIVAGPWYNLTAYAVWTNPNPLGFNERNKIGIEYDPGTLTYTALFDDGVSGWQVVATWTDTTPVISTASTNRRQGYIFDANADLYTSFQGCGFCNTLAYDTLQEPEQFGQVFLLWRDSWSTIG